ncbi:MAG: MFS transporter [Deltaproteobacteria bacterium]|nr:MFS transporter [Deltaproteobacteria bacterium]
MRIPPALNHREFRLFCIGYIPSETGEYIHFVVQNWLVWELTHSAFYLGLIGFFEFAPRFIFGPIGGVIADRMDRLKLLVVSRVLNFLQVLVFAFLIFSGWIQFWHIIFLVIFMAIVSSISTAAQQVLVVSIVPQDSVMSALALHSAIHNLTKVIGPSLGGVLVTLIGSGPSLLVQALTLLWMLVMLFKMKSPAGSGSGARGEWLKDIREGLSYLSQNRRVLVTILTTYSNGFFGISYSQFLPYFAQEVLHVGPAGYGLLVSAPGVGAVGVSFLLSTHTKVRRMRRLLLGASLVFATSIFLFAISRSMLLSIVLLAIVGSVQMSYRVLARAIIQEECPPHLLGRAMSLFFLDRGFGSLGAVCLGSVAALVPVPLAVAGSAVLSGIAAWGMQWLPARERGEGSILQESEPKR